MRQSVLARLMLLALVLVAAPASGGAARAAEDDGQAVTLRPGEAGSKLAPRYSPKGFKLPLVALEKGPAEGHDHLQGRLRLGPQSTQGAGLLLVLARSVPGKAFDLLWIDTNADGSVADEKVQRVKPRTSRGNVYTSFKADIQVNHGSKEKPQSASYPIGLWVAVESESATPAFIRFSRRGFLVGSVTLDDAPYAVVLSDANNDGVLGTGDWWALLDTGAGQVNDIATSRKVGDFAWAGRKAYKLKLTGTAGGEGRVVRFDPGLTPEEDARKRDRLWDDKQAARAKAPLSFEHEIEAAMARARKDGAPYLLDFETVWCGPCKTMDRWVYTAASVVEAAEGIVCIKVDGDERKDLKDAHKVSGFPTGILFDAAGNELARFSGYQSVKAMTAFFSAAPRMPAPRKHVEIRGIYGGVPQVLMEKGRTLQTAGVNAVWIGERGITKARVTALKAQGASVFAEFNTLHRAEYLKKHPDAAPVGADGKPAPAPHGWQGICPTHTAYRTWRMTAFRELLAKHAIDGVWLDYHHAHASWERAEPALPDTCFCKRCLAQFRKDTKTQGADSAQVMAAFLVKKESPQRKAWIRWRCAVFTDWLREFRQILDATRPDALLGTFHCPWTDEERDGALRAKLAIDLRAQKRYLDVFSPMPYHARFGHAQDPAWISRQTRWLGAHLKVVGKADERVKIWPIVQVTDWGAAVSAAQIPAVLDHGTRLPATGVMVFRWGALRKQPEKIEALTHFYAAIGR